MSKKLSLDNKRIVISRTDSIGDVLLTLPLCSWIKQNYTGVTIIFLGKSYTKDIVAAYKAVDEFIDLNDFENLPSLEKLDRFRKVNADVVIHVFPNKEIASLAKKAKVPIRIGTSHRSYHLLTCNYRPNFTRKRSDKHEAQLNFELLKPFVEVTPTLEDIKALSKDFQPQEVALPEFLTGVTNYIILHPKSQGSALEWPIDNYMELAKTLASNGFSLVFTGTDKEGVQFRGHIPTHANIIDSTGKLTLLELMNLIRGAKGFVACSTGPLHVAAYLGVHTVGMYSPKRPIHPGRWMPIGENAKALVFDENCSDCGKGQECKCIEQIGIDAVIEALNL